MTDGKRINSPMATKLVRVYTFKQGKDIHGMGQAIKNFFCSYSGTKVTLTYGEDGSCMISCVTDSIMNASGIEQKINSVVRKASGNDVQIIVTIIQKGNQAEVHYKQDINETLQAAKAVFKSFALIGISELYGIRTRREIPIKLNMAIEQYLNN